MGPHKGHITSFWNLGLRKRPKRPLYQVKSGSKGPYIKTKVARRATISRTKWPEWPLSQDQSGPKGYNIKTKVAQRPLSQDPSGPKKVQNNILLLFTYFFYLSKKLIGSGAGAEHFENPGAGAEPEPKIGPLWSWHSDPSGHFGLDVVALRATLVLT